MKKTLHFFCFSPNLIIAIITKDFFSDEKKLFNGWDELLTAFPACAQSVVT